MLKRYELILQFFCQLPLLALYAVCYSFKTFRVKNMRSKFEVKGVKVVELWHFILLKNIQKYRF